MRSRDEERFNQLVSPHIDAGYNLACWMLRDPNDASDAVQDAAIRAFRSLGSCRGDNGKPWFLAIVRNTTMNVMRSKGVRHRMEIEEGDEALRIADPSPSPEESLVLNQDSEAVRAAIETLPDSLREVVVLREIEEMSYQEIAEVVGIPKGTVMSRLSRARERLMACLAVHP